MTEKSPLRLDNLCERDSCEMLVRIVSEDSVQERDQRLVCERCDRRFAFPWPEWEGKSGRLLELVDKARQGNEAAKSALLVVLETERRPTIFRKLHVGDVRRADLPDGHHDVCLKVYKSIEGLDVAPAYFSYEARIINDVCRKWRRLYQLFGESLDAVLPEVERKNHVQEETSYAYRSTLR